MVPESAPDIPAAEAETPGLFNMPPEALTPHHDTSKAPEARYQEEQPELELPSNILLT